MQRRSQKIIGLTLGVFDSCHQGHVNLLLQAADCCDQLIVGVRTDEAVLKHEGVQPINSETERSAALESLNIASKVIIENDRALLCKEHKVNIVFHGDNIQLDAYCQEWGEDLIEELEINFVMLCHTPGVQNDPSIHPSVN